MIYKVFSKIFSKWVLLSISSLALFACNENLLDESDKVYFSRSSRLDEITDSSVSTLYYHYNGKTITLDIDTTKRFVFFKDNSRLSRSDDERQSKHISHRIADFSSNAGLNLNSREIQDIIASEYVLKDGTPIYNTFWIKLKNESDIHKLTDLAKEISCHILGRYEYDSSWVELSHDNLSNFPTSLEAANYIFESGYFEAVDYDFGITDDNFSSAINYLPADPLFSTQWNLSKSQGINITDAWNYSMGSPDVIVAVVDVKINYEHLDLQGQLTDFHFESGSRFATDNDYLSHGTSVAGVIGAAHNNIYLSGIAPKSKIMPVELFFEDGSLAGSELAKAINYAWTKGASVINCSWSVNPNRPLLEEAFQNALTKGRNGLGAVICFSAGNNYIINYPAYFYDDFIVVGAFDKYGNHWERSGEGYAVDILAPGVDVPVLTNNSSAMAIGTSFSSPHIAGLAALIISYAPWLTQKQIGELIASSGNRKVHSTLEGWGKIDAGKPFYWLNYKFDNFILPETYPYLQNAILTASLDIPFGANILYWSSLKGSIVAKRSNSVDIKYTGTNISDVITVEVEYLGKRYKSSKNITVYNEPIITGIEPIIDIQDINNLHLKIDCSDPTANTTWTVLKSRNGSFEVREFDYKYDAMFSSIANLCASFTISSYAGWNESPSCSILIETQGYRPNSVIANVSWDSFSGQWTASLSDNMTISKKKSEDQSK